MQDRELLSTGLVYFMAAAEEGSFSAAARRLYLSQPAISMKISQLERSIGRPLFDRSTQKPQLTETGRQLYATACAMQREAAAFLAEAASHPASLTIGFTGAAENPELLCFVQAFRRRHPDISLEFRKGSFEEGRRQLLAGTVDCCFGLADTFTSRDRIRCRKLFMNELCVICSFDSPFAEKQCLSPADIAHARFLALDRSYGQGFHNQFLKNLTADGIEPAGIDYVQSFDELVVAVSLGRGIAIISRNLVHATEVAMQSLVDTHAESWYAAIWRDGQAGPTLALFLEEASHDMGQSRI